METILALLIGIALGLITVSLYLIADYHNLWNNIIYYFKKKLGKKSIDDLNEDVSNWLNNTKKIKEKNKK